MPDTSDLAVRMKGYENVQRHTLTGRMPVLIRVDGKSFHTFTKGMQRPFDMILMNAMWETAKYLCDNIMGAKLAYVQSDEITVLLTDYDTLQTQAWFDKNVVKMTSISASMATMAFNKAFMSKLLTNEQMQLNGALYVTETGAEDEATNEWMRTYGNKIGTAMFDSRVWVIPKEEVCNAFIWRQQDATRNSISMVAQSKFSHKQLHKKSANEMQEMLWQEHLLNWNDLDTYLKRGACIVKEHYEKDDMPGVIRSHWIVDKNIPIFTKDRDYIERFVYLSEAEPISSLEPFK